MDFRLSAEEETLRQAVERFVRDELIPLEAEFASAPDIFEGSRWKSRVKTSTDPEIKRYVGLMEELEQKATLAGLWFLDVPKAYGGAQVSNVAMIATCCFTVRPKLSRPAHMYARPMRWSTPMIRQ